MIHVIMLYFHIEEHSLMQKHAQINLSVPPIFAMKIPQSMLRMSRAGSHPDFIGAKILRCKNKKNRREFNPGGTVYHVFYIVF